MPEFIKIAFLFALTAVAEIVGCYLPWLVLKQGKSNWLLLPAAISLAVFAWLLTLHPTTAGDDPDATFDQVSPAEDEIEQLFADRAYDAKTDTWKGIALRKCILVSEDDLTVSQARRFTQWRLEHMSLRADDGQPTPYGVQA